MWKFRDRSDETWDVVLGRESWGAFFAIFVPRGHDAGTRQARISADSYAEATGVVDGMGREEWLELFDGSRPKPTG